MTFAEAREIVKNAPLIKVKSCVFSWDDMIYLSVSREELLFWLDDLSGERGDDPMCFETWHVREDGALYIG